MTIYSYWPTLSDVTTQTPWDSGVTWRSVLVTPPVLQPVTVAYVRDSVLRVTNGSVEDEIIENFIKAATETYEEETGKAAMEQTWQLILSGFPSGAIELPRYPLIEVQAIEYLDGDGAVQTMSGSPANVLTLPSGKYTPGKVVPLYGASWPSVLGQADAVTITYTAGYETAADVPEMVKAGIGLLVKELYRPSPNKPTLDTSRFWRRAW